jgi:NAD(P)-dependent dehydrogenase (short-subunit alcohol dehydrogenase family)
VCGSASGAIAPATIARYAAPGRCASRKPARAAGVRGWYERGVTTEGTDGRTVVITGASDGVGAAVARALVGSGLRTVVVGRSPEKTRAVGESVGAAAILTADFSRLDDVRRLADQLREIAPRPDVLINNAGGAFDPSKPTPDGYEPNAQINHLAPFLLTNLLHDRLAAVPGGALVINTSSVGNLGGRVRPDRLVRTQPSFLRGFAYSSSKLMNILFTRGITKRWAADGIVSVAVHPGPVATSFGRESTSFGMIYRSPLRKLLISAEAAAVPFVDLTLRGADPAVNGAYFSRSNPKGRTNPQANDAALADALWDVSADLVKL